MEYSKMKMWDGRFTKATDSLMEEINHSLPIDKIFAEEDIEGSIAWAGALRKAGAVSSEDADAITAGLQRLLRKAREGKLEFMPSDEDIHMAVERLLVEDIGEAGARLHTGRSRNDQVATDFRLFLKRRLQLTLTEVNELQKVLLSRAESDRSCIISGYTHLQQAQPVSLSHYWLSFFFALERDKTRLRNAIVGADIMPLGSGALAGSGFEVDREGLARDLGFSRITENSMDGVAARDFVLEALSALASLGILLSRYAEDLILWSSREFSYVELDDAWSTGSSMMPQKKNPDSLELIRSKAGRFLGNYTRFAVTLKGVGLTYYKDLQEDKEPFIDSVQQMSLVLRVFGKVIETLAVNDERVEEMRDPLLLATDLADYLSRKGVPFRHAHKVVGKIVGACLNDGRRLTDLTPEDLRAFDTHFEDDAAAVLDWESSLNNRNVAGGTGPKSVERQLEQARQRVDR